MYVCVCDFCDFSTYSLRPLTFIPPCFGMEATLAHQYRPLTLGVNCGFKNATTSQGAFVRSVQPQQHFDPDDRSPTLDRQCLARIITYAYGQPLFYHGL